MARVIFVLLVLAGMVAVSAVVLAALGRGAEGRDQGRALPHALPERLGSVQKISYALLLVVMFGVASGVMGQG